MTNVTLAKRLTFVFLFLCLAGTLSCFAFQPTLAASAAGEHASVPASPFVSATGTPGAPKVATSSALGNTIGSSHSIASIIAPHVYRDVFATSDASPAQPALPTDGLAESASLATPSLAAASLLARQARANLAGRMMHEGSPTSSKSIVSGSQTPLQAKQTALIAHLAATLQHSPAISLSIGMVDGFFLLYF